MSGDDFYDFEPFSCRVEKRIGDQITILRAEDVSNITNPDVLYKQYCNNHTFHLPKIFSKWVDGIGSILDKNFITNSGTSGLTIELEWKGSPDFVVTSIVQHIKSTMLSAIDKEQIKCTIHILGSYICVHFEEFSATLYDKSKSMIKRMKVLDDLGSYQYGVDRMALKRIVHNSNKSTLSPWDYVALCFIK